MHVEDETLDDDESEEVHSIKDKHAESKESINY